MSSAGVFYYTLGNIRPMFHSRLQAIQLISVAKYLDIRQYGFDAFDPEFHCKCQYPWKGGFQLELYTCTCILPCQLTLYVL